LSLFDAAPLGDPDKVDKKRPLADRMRPVTLDEFAGQDHVLGPGKPLRRRSSTTS
jgi:putative ATPase